MTAPGEILEMEEVIQSGQKIRTWKNVCPPLPPSFSALIPSHSFPS